MISSIALSALSRMIPSDETPGVADPQLRSRLEALVQGLHKSLWTSKIEPGLQLLAAEAMLKFGRKFETLDDDQQDDLLKAFERGEVSHPQTSEASKEFVTTLATLAAELYYASPDSTAWADIGYQISFEREADAEIVETQLPTKTFSELEDQYDILIIGSGAGGGSAAGVLAEAGLRVLVIERGEMLEYDQISKDHLRNHRYHFRGHNTGPDIGGNPRIYAGDGSIGDQVFEEPWSLGWSNNAMTVGGGTRVYQGMAWRMLPEDFRLASTYGVPDGSSLADWPITYEELEPYYDMAEWEVGVCGDGSAHKVQGRRSRPYPLAPFEENIEAGILKRGAEKLGLTTGPVPLLINSKPYNGRAACIGCSHCVGFPCPSNAKNGSFNTYLERAIATGRCDLVTGVQATEIVTDSHGRATGAKLVDWRSRARREIEAEHVIVAAGAMETARLLLNSKSEHHPAGLGNGHDQVGRHLQGHVYIQAFGLFDEPIATTNGPGVSVSTCDYNHDGSSGTLGGVLHNEVIRLPIFHYFTCLPPEIPRWGLETKQAMREMYSRTSMVYGPVQEVPTPDCRVTVSDNVKDKHGTPVLRWGGALHPETVRAAELHRNRAEAWISASGAKRTWASPIIPFFYAGQHQAGSCRMGDDPTSSVTDRDGKVHGHDNLWVMDASLHVTNGGFNPVLTVYALALRSAHILARTVSP